MSEEQAEYITKRKGIPKRIRFEVFKRDSFVCQYCGQESPGVILEIDQIDPVTNGGDGDIMHLVTACEDVKNWTDWKTKIENLINLWSTNG